jgi:GntR family transcriptional repressor for pyruvate dehydrogenase complex
MITGSGQPDLDRKRWIMRGRRTLSGVVADLIIRDIRDGTLKPGDRLPTLKELSAEHEVGYGVAREAMQQLVALGLVDVRPRRGAVVREFDTSGGLDDSRLAILLSDQAVEELYDLRLLVEVAIAGQAATSATEEQLEGILSAQRAFDAALRADRQIHSADVDLHSSIARASGNTVFLRVLDTLRGILAEVRSQAIAVPGASEAAKREHDAIVKAILARDPEAARAAMTKHIETAKRTVMEARGLTKRA